LIVYAIFVTRSC